MKDLFDTGGTSKAEVEEYIRENPKTWALFQKFAFEAINAGRKRIGAKMIAERIRWEALVARTGEYKFNNNFTAGFARKFMEVHPQHEGVFATRGAASDD